MKIKDFTKVGGGLAIMFSVFLLLAVAKQLVSNGEAIKTTLVQEKTEETSNQAPTSNNIVSGSFNINTSGNLIQGYDESKKFHYKAIPSEKLKNKNTKPVLELEIIENGKKAWKQTEWSWIDYDQGILYFYFKTTTENSEEMADNFTGKYKLTF